MPGVPTGVAQQVHQQPVGGRMLPEVLANPQRVEHEAARAEVVDRHHQARGVVLRGLDRAGHGLGRAGPVPTTPHRE